MKRKRLAAFTSAIALAAVAVSGRRRFSFEAASSVCQAERAAFEFVRCFCSECVRADAREAWGAWQYRLL